MQLYACLMLLLIATDKTLALPQPRCNDDHLDLSQEPSGHIVLTSKGFAHTPTTDLLVCTRTLHIPAAHRLLLKLVWLETGSNMSLRCVLEKESQILQVGDTVLLHDCHQNRATLTWTGAGRSSNAFELFYYVQEDERNSTAAYTSPRSDHIILTQTTSTEERHLSQTADSSGHPTPNSLQSTTPLPAAWSSDREALLFPQEGLDNGTDTAATSHRTDNPGTQDYFHTQHPTSTDSRFQIVNTQRISMQNENASTDKDFYTSASMTPFSGTTDPKNQDATRSLVDTGTQVSGNLRTQDYFDTQSSVSTIPMFKSTGHTVGELSESEISTRFPISTDRGLLRTTSHTLENKEGIVVHSTVLDIGSTEFPRNTPTSGAHWQSTRVNGQTTAPGSEPNQESIATTDLTMSSLGTAGPNLDSTLVSTQTSIATDTKDKELTSQTLASSTYWGFEEKSEGTQIYGQNMLTATVSSLTQENERTTRFSAESTVGDVVLEGKINTELNTVRTNDELGIDLSTDSPSSTSIQQTSGTQSTWLTTEHRVHLTTSPNILETGGQTETGHDQREAEERGPHQTPSAPHTYMTTAASWSSTVLHKPKFFIVPDVPAAIRVESIELLLQITVEESRSTFTASLEEDTANWLEPYLQRAPGFTGLQAVWSSGRAVQCLVEFDTRGALQWLSGETAAASVLELTGLKQAEREAGVSNVTLGGFHGDVCGWLLQCPSGFICVFHPLSSNYSCTSVCHSDYCHHHGLCTHHPGQLPVCRCLVGEDFWFMGQRCEVRMTRVRLVLTCLSVLLVLLAVIAVLACVAVRRYRALLIQAKVDQTRSSYRRFNHFDELSGRFWLRSWAGSADSLDNPAFSRSDELLHLRALERPCCYHDDTMSLPSTCPSPRTHIRTIYPHSSQYAWRGSDLSMGDGVLDSGKASDLSVCSWPVEPIQWSPFPLLQSLALQRTPTQVRVSRPRSYCEGMELVDMGKSWTA